MSRRLPCAAAALAALLLAAPALGQNNARNRVSFRVEAQREVSHDWATADIGVEQRGRNNPADLAAAAQQRLASSLDLAKRTPGIIASDGSYRILPIYDRNSASGRIVGWRVSQSMKLESGDLSALGALLGQLQDAGLVLHDLRMGVSPKTLSRIEDELLAEVLGMYRTQANLIAQGLGRSSWTLVDLIVDDAPQEHSLSGQGPPGDSPPIISEGMSKIFVTLDATIEVE